MNCALRLVSFISLCTFLLVLPASAVLIDIDAQGIDTAVTLPGEAVVPGGTIQEDINVTVGAKNVVVFGTSLGDLINVDAAGLITYAASLEGVVYTGSGSNTLVIVGHSITVSSLGLSGSASVQTLASPSPAQTITYELPAGPLYRINAQPGGALSAANVGVEVNFGVGTDGIAIVDPSLSDILSVTVTSPPNPTSTVTLLGGTITLDFNDLSGHMLVIGLPNPGPVATVDYELPIGQYLVQGVPGDVMVVTDSAGFFDVTRTATVDYAAAVEGSVFTGSGTSTLGFVGHPVELDATSSSFDLTMSGLTPAALAGGTETFSLPRGRFTVRRGDAIGFFEVARDGTCFFYAANNPVGSTYVNGPPPQILFDAGSQVAQLNCPPGASDPIADAGPDQGGVAEDTLVTLDGSASENATGFSWTQIGGIPTVTLDLTDPVQPTFDAPFVNIDTTFTFELVVDDGVIFSDPDTVDITVVSVNDPPVADAGNDSTIKEGAVATLDGSNSFDPEGDTPLFYAWTQSAGPLLTLLPSNTVVSPTFVAPIGVGTLLTFDLSVDDGKETSASDSVTIEVVENSAPVADAGVDQTKDEGSLVTLDGSGSNDPDGGDTLGFQWTQVAGTGVTLSDPNSSSPTFDAPVVAPGGEDLEFELVVSDDDPINPKSSAADAVVVTVTNINDPPSCDLGRSVCSASKINSNDDCLLWPPNHKMLVMEIAGVADADSVYNDVTLEITGVTQDEPVDGLGDGDSSPDAVIQIASPADSALIRSERSGAGNGRVYVVSFTADDGFESCDGSVTVGVPHNRKGTPVDDGQLFDATQP